jgi:hypothetical protein
MPEIKRAVQELACVQIVLWIIESVHSLVKSTSVWKLCLVTLEYVRDRSLFMAGGGGGGGGRTGKKCFPW